MSGKPWFRFYPDPWRADIRLRSCSPLARCLWLELCIIMEESGGELLIAGVSPTIEDLSRQAALSIEQIQSGIAELNARSVPSYTQSGVMFSRKMVRDARKSREQSDRAKKRKWLENKEDQTSALPDAMPDSGIAHAMPQNTEVRILSSLSGGGLVLLDPKRAEKLAGDAMASKATLPGMATLGPLNALLRGDPACDPEDDIYPAIAAAAAWHRQKGGAGSMTSWTTASRMALENRDRRIAGAPPPKEPTHDRQSVTDLGPAGRRRAANMERAFNGAYGPSGGRTGTGPGD